MFDLVFSCSGGTGFNPQLTQTELCIQSSSLVRKRGQFPDPKMKIKSTSALCGSTSHACERSLSTLEIVSTGSPSHCGDVTVYVWHKPTELSHSFLFCSCVCFYLYGPFNYISLSKSSRQLSIFSLCSSGLISASLVLSAICLFTKVSLCETF